jgi:CHAT domain-containing protein
VTSTSVEAFELPGRAKIETLARQVYEGLRTLDAGDPELLAAKAAARRELSRMVLGPVADRLSDRRLAVVADGALQYVPFAALPSPDDPAGLVPLVERHEIVVLPSASVLALRSQEPASAGTAGMSIAILADPVFDSRDPRVPRASPKDGAPLPVRSGISLTRLAASSREAAAIAELAPGRIWTALGFQASRATAFGGELARHRIVHFATHGVIDSETPQLSGLVLSLVDEEGRAQEGFLGLDDIYNLDLHSDLVVLSGCETALGREMRGEGLVGLTRGFLYAGAARVLASLWQVQDRPATELMVRFYRAMLQDRLPPAAALRAAQLSLSRERRWQDPFYWGAFVLQGDWH